MRTIWLLLCCTTLLNACAPLSSLPATGSPSLVIAHRGGAADAPENTLEAIRQSIDHGADGIWLTVQLSKDGVPVLYRPADLSALTDASGPVSSQSAAELAAVNAGWTFELPGQSGVRPYRDKPVGIPTLQDALRLVPMDMLLFLDMKALPAAPQAAAGSARVDRRARLAPCRDLFDRRHLSGKLFGLPTGPVVRIARCDTLSPATRAPGRWLCRSACCIDMDRFRAEQETDRHRKIHLG